MDVLVSTWLVFAVWWSVSFCCVCVVLCQDLIAHNLKPAHAGGHSFPVQEVEMFFLPIIQPWDAPLNVFLDRCLLSVQNDNIKPTFKSSISTGCAAQLCPVVEGN